MVDQGSFLTLSALEVEAIGLSLKVAFSAVAISLPFGVFVAWILARCEFWGRSVLNVAVHLPLILPPVVVGYLLLLLLGRRGPLGAWLFDVFGITVAFTWKGAAIAAGVMAFPLMVRAIRLSLEAVDRRLEQVARTLGARPERVFFSVTLPLCLPGIVTGSVLAFARCLGEFGATITFVSNIPEETRTLPLALYSLVQTPGGDAGAIRLVLISVALAMAALACSEIMARRVAARVGGDCMLEVDIHLQKGDFELDARFTAEAGLTALFGRSGAGKSSLVNALAGLERPDRGKIAIDGTVLFDSSAGIDLPVEKRRLGYVFQESRLFPHLTVKGNLFFGMRLLPRTEKPKDIETIIEMLDLGPLLTRRPRTLSGGERQRVAIGRALLASPRILLMDEPLASLDAGRKAEILPFIERLRDVIGLPIVYVSHAIAEVIRIADTLVVMSDGMIAATGPVETIMSRLDLYPLTGRYETGAVLAATVCGKDLRYGLSELAFGQNRLWIPKLDLPIGTPLRVRIRARDVALSLEKPNDISCQNIFEGTIREMDGSDAPLLDVLIDVGSPLIARVTRRSAEQLGLKPGKRVFALIKAVAIDRPSLGRHGATSRL